MGKYRTSSTRNVKERSRDVHIAWRGIGCLMMLIIPVISIASAVVLIDYGLANRWPIPYQLLGYVSYPSWVYSSSGLIQILSPIAGIKNFYAYMFASVLLMILLAGVMSVVYAFIYRIIGPSRYGPLDVERPNIKIKKYKR